MKQAGTFGPKSHSKQNKNAPLFLDLLSALGSFKLGGKEVIVCAQAVQHQAEGMKENNFKLLVFTCFLLFWLKMVFGKH